MPLLHMDLILYLIIVLCTAINWLLFMLFWLKVGQVSYIFKLFSFLMLGIFVQNFGSLISAVQKHEGERELVWDFLHSWWWPWRLVPTALCCSIFVVHFMWRYYHMNDKGEINYGRRKDD